MADLLELLKKTFLASGCVIAGRGGRNASQIVWTCDLGNVK